MNEMIKQSRINFDKMGENYPIAQDVTIDKEVIENIDCYWFRAKDKDEANKIVIYLHGGCFVMGSIRSHQALVSHLAKELELPVLFVEYGLAPEIPFPKVINDILQVYKNIRVQYSKSELIFMGDSAGAGLSVSLISKINESGLSIPASVIMISPWVDVSCSFDSIIQNAKKDPILKKERLLELAAFYIGNQQLSEVNPIESKFEKFPPTLILVGSKEILLDDSRFIHQKIMKTKAKSTLSIYQEQTHVWLLDNIDVEPSKKAILEMKAFLDD